MPLPRFRTVALATTVVTYLLITVGALVRATGAGMGCPDWPRCYGQWIPPSTAAEVPARWQASFDVTLMWIEYLNRLLGAVTGLLVVATVWTAWRVRRAAPSALAPAAGALGAVGVAGWLGKRVVEKHLAAGWVTVHMFVALATVALLGYAVAATYPRLARLSVTRARLAALALAAAAVTALQIALGTRVRATLELIARTFPALPRASWITRVGAIDHAHRTLALLVLGACALVALAGARTGSRVLARLSAATALGALAQIAAGIGLAYVALPPALQVVHVALGSVLLGGLLALAWAARRAPRAASERADIAADRDDAGSFTAHQGS